MEVHDIYAIDYWKKCSDAEQKDEEMGFIREPEECIEDETIASGSAPKNRLKHRLRYTDERYYAILSYCCLFYMVYWAFTDVYRSEN